MDRVRVASDLVRLAKMLSSGGGSGITFSIKKSDIDNASFKGKLNIGAKKIQFPDASPVKVGRFSAEGYMDGGTFRNAQIFDCYIGVTNDLDVGKELFDELADTAEEEEISIKQAFGNGKGEIYIDRIYKETIMRGYTRSKLGKGYTVEIPANGYVSIGVRAEKEADLVIILQLTKKGEDWFEDVFFSDDEFAAENWQ